MAKTDFQSVDEYIAAQAEELRPALAQVRAVIRGAVPDAKEVISYQMPAYRLNGRIFLFFAGWKGHYSIYPGSSRTVEALKQELAPYEISKGTIRFPLSQPVPADLIARIAKLRANEVRGER